MNSRTQTMSRSPWGKVGEGLMAGFEDLHVLCPQKLVEHLDFLDSNPWTSEGHPLTRDDIARGWSEGWVGLTEYPEHDIHCAAQWTLDDHLARIVTLARDWTEHRAWPITLSVQEDGETYVASGNHRLAAAWFLRAPFILVTVDGFLDPWEAVVDGLSPSCPRSTDDPA